MKKSLICSVMLIGSLFGSTSRVNAGEYLGHTADVWLFYALANLEHAILNQLNHPLIGDYNVLHTVHEDIVGAYAAYVIYGSDNWAIEYIVLAYFSSLNLSSYFTSDPAILTCRLDLFYAFLSLY